MPKARGKTGYRAAKRDDPNAKQIYAAAALAQVIAISCQAGFGRFDSSSNALDDEIDKVAGELIDLLTQCLPKRVADRIAEKATKQGIYDDAIACGLSQKEARALAGDGTHPLDKALRKQHEEMTKSLQPISFGTK